MINVFTFATGDILSNRENIVKYSTALFQVVLYNAQTIGDAF